jgi:hypothetical protein
MNEKPTQVDQQSAMAVAAQKPGRHANKMKIPLPIESLNNPVLSVEAQQVQMGSRASRTPIKLLAEVAGNLFDKLKGR